MQPVLQVDNVCLLCLLYLVSPTKVLGKRMAKERIQLVHIHYTCDSVSHSLSDVSRSLLMTCYVCVKYISAKMEI